MYVCMYTRLEKGYYEERDYEEGDRVVFFFFFERINSVKCFNLFFFLFLSLSLYMYMLVCV